jgi:hypothetical protein
MFLPIAYNWGDVAWSYGRNQRQEAFQHYNGLVAKYRRADSKVRRPLEDQTSLDLGIPIAEGHRSACSARKALEVC